MNTSHRESNPPLHTGDLSHNHTHTSLDGGSIYSLQLSQSISSHPMGLSDTSLTLTDELLNPFTFNSAMARAHLAIGMNNPMLPVPVHVAPQKLESVPDGKYKCEMCNRHFSRYYNLKSHIKTHDNAKPFSCAYCTQSFARWICLIQEA
jgi:uncharacterized Zn-finger protein